MEDCEGIARLKREQRPQGFRGEPQTYRDALMIGPMGPIALRSHEAAISVDSMPRSPRTLGNLPGSGRALRNPITGVSLFGAQGSRVASKQALESQVLHDLRTCLDLNQEFSVEDQVTHCTSCGESYKNGDMVVPCSGSSNMDHPRALETDHGDLAAVKFCSELPELQEQRDSRISMDLNPLFCVRDQVTQATSSGDSCKNRDIDVPCSGSSNMNHQGTMENEQSDAEKFFSNLNQDSSVDGQIAQRVSSGDGGKNRDMNVSCSGSSNIDHLRTQDIGHGDMGAGKKLQPLTLRRVPWRKYRADTRDPILLSTLLSADLSWEERVVNILHVVRCREMTEYNPKTERSLPTRFCEMNIAFFDLDKESDVKRNPNYCKIPDNRSSLDSSINIISIKVAESDVPYPIEIYGTVLARDKVDYRCVYLFKRDRGSPQLVKSKDDTLNLTGPNRALSFSDTISFEFNLKIKGVQIKGEDTADQDFSKGEIECHGCCGPDNRPRTKSLFSFLSEVEMKFQCVSYALEASLEVNILNGKSHFLGKITAGDKNDGIILYDSKVAGTETKIGSCGSVLLTRRVVAVPWGRSLLLNFSVPRSNPKSIRLKQGDKQWTCKMGTYKVQVKVTWAGVFLRQRLRVWKKIKHTKVLW